MEALLDKYMNSGIYEIEKTEILRLDPFMRMGKPAKIASYFGGKAGYLQAIRELEEELYIVAEFSRHRCASPQEELLTIQNEGKYTEEYLSLTREFYLFA